MTYSFLFCFVFNHIVTHKSRTTYFIPIPQLCSTFNASLQNEATSFGAFPHIVPKGKQAKYFSAAKQHRIQHLLVNVYTVCCIKQSFSQCQLYFPMLEVLENTYFACQCVSLISVRMVKNSAAICLCQGYR